MQKALMLVLLIISVVLFIFGLVNAAEWFLVSLLALGIAPYDKLSKINILCGISAGIYVLLILFFAREYWAQALAAFSIFVIFIIKLRRYQNFVVTTDVTALRD